MKFRKPERDPGWYRLDNAAKLFPAVSDASNSNVFRMVCELKDSVDRAVLQRAAEQTLEEFPTFRVRLRKGLFWYFLEHNPELVKVHREIHPPCSYFKGISHRKFLFEISYYKNKINLDVFHVIADGTGAMQFLRSLVYHYLQLKYAQTFTENTPPSNCEAPPFSRAEDAFRKYYQKSKKSSPFERKAYRITGNRLMPGEIKVISGQMPVKQVLKLAKQSRVSLTSYLTAAVIYAIYQENMPRGKRNRPIKVNIPVNLRNQFPSITSRNFFACIEAGCIFDRQPLAFAQILDIVQRQIKEGLLEQNLSQRISFQVSTERNFLIRCLPLALKNIGLRLGYSVGEKAYSTALSNMGTVEMPDYLSPYIENFNLIMSTSPYQPVKFGVCSYRDKLNVTYSAAIQQPDIARYLFCFLSEQGVDITLTTNEVEKP